jgi:hypothetical protein
MSDRRDALVMTAIVVLAALFVGGERVTCDVEGGDPRCVRTVGGPVMRPFPTGAVTFAAESRTGVTAVSSRRRHGFAAAVDSGGERFAFPTRATREEAAADAARVDAFARGQAAALVLASPAPPWQWALLAGMGLLTAWQWRRVFRRAR